MLLDFEKIGNFIIKKHQEDFFRKYFINLNLDLICNETSFTTQLLLKMVIDENSEKLKAPSETQNRK